MAKNKYTVHKLKTTTPNTEIDVYISFDDAKDGWNRPTGNPKGYILHIQPVTRENIGNGLQVTTFSAYSGIKAMLESAGRFSQKRIAEVAAYAPTNYAYVDGLKMVLASNKLALA